MQKILEHTKLINRLNNNNINLDFIKKFDIDNLAQCCERLENSDVKKELYADNSVIQEELIADVKFINYLKIFISKGIEISRISAIIEKLQENNQRASYYRLSTLLHTLHNANITSDIICDYLKYFCDKAISKTDQDIVARNLHYFRYQEETEMSALEQSERDLFFLPFMADHNLIPIDYIKKVCSLLTQDKELKNIILFLFSNNLKVPLSLREYELIHKNSKINFEYISKFNKLLDNDTMYRLLLRWLDNGCSLYDLKIIDSKLQVLDKSIINKAVYNKSSYINFIFGNRLSNFPLEYIDGARENLLIYAISNNKKRFLQLIQENKDIFLKISMSSLLYNEAFYNKYINLNTLTLKHLKDLITMSDYNLRIDLLKQTNYTFEEIKLLYNIPDQYLKLYNHLLNLKIDERILIIKQLIKRNLLHRDISDYHIKKLAEKLSIKHLYRWLEDDFSHIKGLSSEYIIKILINYEMIQKFIPQINNQTELLYVMRNLEKIQKYNNLEVIKENIENIDEYWKELVNIININEKFVNEHKNSIKFFLLNNGAELALTYYKSCSSNDKETFKKIVKAELMGQFWRLKYYANDLNKEIEYDLKDKHISEWISNKLVIEDDEIQVKEYDDFYSTMVLGESPQHTCLSYKGGAYNQCLMACFDSNKKILYAKINDKIVARAMVRLTKGTYNNNMGKKEKLSFVDLEKEPNNKENKKEEYLTIFLERPYIAGVSGIQENKILEMFISLVEQKAVNMNALLVLSNAYSDVVSKDYVVTRYHLYISKSKAGSQYLDSLNGENTISDEGEYKANTFMIWQKQK